MCSNITMSGIQKQRVDFFLEMMKNSKRKKILDIGCQSGDVCYQLYENGHEPYGIDVVEEVIDTARDKYPKIDFRVGDCETQLSFEDKFFDVVWAGDLIEHIHFTDTFINEVNRVLKLGGLFILTTPMHNRLKSIIISLYNFEEHFNPEFPHLRFYTLKSLRRVLETRGFRIVRVKYLGRIQPFAKSMFVIAKKLKDRKIYSKHRH